MVHARAAHMGNGEEEMKISWGLGLPPERRHIAAGGRTTNPLSGGSRIHGQGGLTSFFLLQPPLSFFLLFFFPSFLLYFS